MKIYIDSNYVCHSESGNDLREVESPFFDGKAATVINGYRFVPEGETWNGFVGEIYTPIRPYYELESEQLKWELEKAKAELSDATSALEVLGVTKE